ncbi:MAG: ABC transporter permease [Chloroflexi bacterium]|nr:ABC transporter permease [Chloroflexota bacterium]
MLKNLRRKTFGDLKANWGQFLAVWLVVTLGTAFYGAMYPAGVNMRESLYRTYDQLHYMDFQVQLGDALMEPQIVDEVRAVPGVENAEGRLVIEGGVQLDADQDYPVSLRLISVPDDREPSVNQNDITDGRTIQGPDELLLLKSFADWNEIEPGDELRVRVNDQMLTMTVAGLVFNPEYLVAGRNSTSPFPALSSFGVAWVRYSWLAGQSGVENGQINDVVVHLPGESSTEPKAGADDVREHLNALFDGTNAQVFARKQTASGGVIDANINGVFPLMRFYSGVFLLGSTIITGVLLARLVESERQRIGTLRAMGVTRRELMLHYLTFGAFIGITGGLVGSILGYLNSFWVMNTFLHYLAGGTLPGFVNTPQIPFLLLGFVIVAAGSTVAGAYPAWVQSRTPPGVALRPATPKTPNAISQLRLRFLPPVLRRAVRGILRCRDVRWVRRWAWSRER